MFLEEPFTIVFGEGVEGYTHMTVMADTDGTFPPKPVFILFIVPKRKWNSVARKDTEDMLEKLLGEAETPIDTIHGAIVCGAHITFYHYDRQEGVFAITKESQEQTPSDIDLTTEDGIDRMLQVVEEVKDICRKLIGVLKPGKIYKDGAWVTVEPLRPSRG
jgi:hypothetical protein